MYSSNDESLASKIYIEVKRLYERIDVYLAKFFNYLNIIIVTVCWIFFSMKHIFRIVRTCYNGKNFTMFEFIDEDRVPKRLPTGNDIVVINGGLFFLGISL